MSGTKAHKKREEEKARIAHERLVDLNNNRTTLLQATIAELILLYGEDNVNIKHPLFSAIQASANGSIIDIDKLSSDISDYKAEV